MYIDMHGDRWWYVGGLSSRGDSTSIVIGMTMSIKGLGNLTGSSFSNWDWKKDT